MNSVRTRILLFFTLFATASFLAVYMSSRGTKVVGRAAHGVVNEHLPMVQALGKMRVALQKQDNAVYRYMTTADKFWMDAWEKERLIYSKWYSEAQNWTTENLEQDKLQQIDENYIQYDNFVRQVLLLPSSQNSKRKKLLAKSNRSLEEIEKLVNQIEGIRQGMTLIRQEQITETLNRHQKLGYYFLATIMIFFVVLAGYLWYSLVRPLTLLMNGIRNFTRGKMDVQIPPVGKDELGELQESFNEMSREIEVERKRLQAQSQSDSLTGLFNMRYFRRQLVEEFTRSQRYGRPLTLLMIDVDHFKSYNDRNGHPAGDIVLKEISRILIRNVRGTDIVARYGGEEFVILLPETTKEAALKVAEKIRLAVEMHHFPFRESNAPEKVTISVGVAAYPDIQVSSDQDLIEAADKSLYQAKENGRNQICVFAKGQVVTPKDVKFSIK